jgi:putative beta-lysine N-acetyltransferase
MRAGRFLSMVSEKFDNHVLIDRPNQRIKIMECTPLLFTNSFLDQLAELEKETKSSKTIIYAKKAEVEFFLTYGFHLEGYIDGFFNGQNAYILARFSLPERAVSQTMHEADAVLQMVQNDTKPISRDKELPDGMVMRKAKLMDADPLAALYRSVFKSYPSPMDDPKYIKKVMQDHTWFMVIEHADKIVCAASAEVTPKNNCAELTDCATLSDYRGQSLLSHLFYSLEDWLEEQGIYYLFSLTRSLSPGMNLTTARHGYSYRGRLVNNCDIYSGFEDMNIWVKPLRSIQD